jgi:hypothetical protein
MKKTLVAMISAFVVVPAFLFGVMQTNSFLVQTPAGLKADMAAAALTATLISHATETSSLFHAYFTGFDGKTAKNSQFKGGAKNRDVSKASIVRQEKLDHDIQSITYSYDAPLLTNIPAFLTNAVEATLSTNLKADYADFTKFQLAAMNGLLEGYFLSKMTAELKAPYAQKIGAVYILTGPSEESLSNGIYSLKISLKAAIR